MGIISYMGFIVCYIDCVGFTSDEVTVAVASDHDYTEGVCSQHAAPPYSVIGLNLA